MQITGYTTQSSLIRLWTHTSSLFSLPNPMLEMPQKEKGVMDLGNSHTDWEILSRRVVFGFQCAQQIAAQRERTGNHRGKAGMERPSFPLPLLPLGRSLEAGKQQCPLSGWHWSMPPPSRVKRQRGSWKGKGILGCFGWQMGRGDQWWAGGAGGNIKPRP